MWPKALAQLIELAPHITRLVPLADRFFQSKSAGEETNRRAMEAMAEGLRGDLGQVTAAHSGLYRQLLQQSEKLSVISGDLRAAMVSSDAIELHVSRLQNRVNTITIALAASLLMNLATLVVMIVVFVHLR